MEDKVGQVRRSSVGNGSGSQANWGRLCLVNDGEAMEGWQVVG